MGAPIGNTNAASAKEWKQSWVRAMARRGEGDYRKTLDVLDAVLAVCLGARCTSCGAPLDRPSHGAVCSACWSALRVFVPPLCPRCGTPLPSQGPVPGSVVQGGQALPQAAPGCCRACPALATAVDAARAVGPHEGVLRDAVHALKYHGLVSVAVPIAARMRDAGRALLTGADAVAPMPLHPAREWRRGFNQAELLARRLGLPVVPALCRLRVTPPQTGLDARERARNVRGGFALAGRPGAHRPLPGLHHRRHRADG